MEHTAKEPQGLAALLPVTLREDCYLLMREVKKTVTPQEAMRQAEKALALREQDWAEAKIISREAVGTESPEGYTCLLYTSSGFAGAAFARPLVVAGCALCRAAIPMG